MSVEATIAVISKWGWGTIVGYLIWLKKKDKDKLDNTYTKIETDKLVVDKVATVKDKLELQTQSLADSFELKHKSLVDKCDTLITLMKSDIIENKKARSDNSELLHEIKLDVAVVKNNFDNLSENVKELKSDVHEVQMKVNN